MAGNLRNQNLAFQAAESALRDAEIDLEKDIKGTGHRDTIKTDTHFGGLCNASFGTTTATRGLCRTDNTTGTWQAEIVTASGWDWNNDQKTVVYGTYTGATPLPSVARPPRYVIEWLQEKDDNTTTPWTRHFRITARGWGGVEASHVTLQTVYRMSMEGP
jgi:type IV pilus assembly protein PilX